MTRFIAPAERKNIANLLSKGFGEPVHKQIVSGPLDADKQDYFLRDSHFCGVKYGLFDIHKLHQELRVVTDPTEGEKHLAITEDGIHALEQFLLAKFYLSSQIYYNKVRLITDQMLIRSLHLAIENNEIPGLRDAYSYDGTIDATMRYIEWDDLRFLHTCRDENLQRAQCFGLMRRLFDRRLLKCVYKMRLDELPELVRQVVDISKPEHRKERADLEGEVSKVIQGIYGFEVDSNYVIVHGYSIGAKDEGEILVDMGRERPISFRKVSKLYGLIIDRLSEAYVEVYAPVEYETKAEGESLRRKLRQPITDCLNSFYKPKGDGDGDS